MQNHPNYVVFNITAPLDCVPSNHAFNFLLATVKQEKLPAWLKT